MTKNMFLFDSYALIEIFRGNEKYTKYSDATILLTKLNVFEVYQSFLKKIDEDTADLFLDKYWKYVKEIEPHIIQKAAKLRLKYKNKNLSMTDCIGYALADYWCIPFLTGDREFKDLPNVEFVK